MCLPLFQGRSISYAWDFCRPEFSSLRYMLGIYFEYACVLWLIGFVVASFKISNFLKKIVLTNTKALYCCWVPSPSYFELNFLHVLILFFTFLVFIRLKKMMIRIDLWAITNALIAKTTFIGWVKSIGYLALQSEIYFVVAQHPQSEKNVYFYIC